MKRTHKGLMYGCVPVYLNMDCGDCPEVEGRNLLCEIGLSIVEPLFGLFTYIMTALDPAYEPMYPIKITGETNDN